MSTPLHSANLATEDMAMHEVVEAGGEHGAGGAPHIHMPNPSLWPLITGFFLIVCMAGLVFINSFPWVSIIAGIFVVIGILGFAIEDPFAARTGEERRSTRMPTNYAEAEEFGRPTALAEMVLEEAQHVADETVTVSSIEWSAHPVQVEIEREGVVLALYGKVELETQKQELEKRLLAMPGVIDVKNFLVAEDALLHAITAVIEKLRASGKLEGARDISALVENYIVNLYGYTPTDEMKYMLERQIVGIPGVRVVVNHIGLDEDIPGNLGRTNNKVGK